MRSDPQGVASARHPRTHRRWVRRLLLAATLVVVALGIVGMHPMAFGRDMAVIATASAAQGGHADHAGRDGSGEMLPMGAGHAGGNPDAGTSGTGTSSTGTGGGCPDCVDHQMALGSCLLALTLLVLRWLLAPPRPACIPPSLLRLARLSRPAASCVAGRLIPPLSLAELSVLRT